MSTSTRVQGASLVRDGQAGRRRERWAIVLSVAVSAAVAGAWVVLLYAGIALSVSLTPRPLPLMHMRLAALPPAPIIELEHARRGREVFALACAVCHGSRGLGRPGLGRDIVHSDFVADRDDPALIAFVLTGRPVNDPLNTTGVAMPPKGGHDALVDADIAAVVAYMRGLQDPRRMPDLPPFEPVAAVPSQAEQAAALEAAGGDEELAAWIASGSRLFASNCIACHGAGGVGVTGNGKALAGNPFVRDQDEDELLAFLLRGRDPGDPINTTGVGMPAKGGNPALSDDDLLDIITYLKTLQ